MITRKEILEELRIVKDKASLIFNPKKEEWKDVIDELDAIKSIIKGKMKS